MIKFLFSLFIFFASVSFALGQTLNLRYAEDVIDLKYSKDLGTPKSFRITDNSPLRFESPKEVLSKILNIDHAALNETQSTQIGQDITIKRFSRSIDDIKIAHGTYTVLIKNGEISSLHAEHYEKSIAKKSRNLSEKEALERMLEQIDSDLYAWESTEILLKNPKLTTSQRSKLQEALKQDYPKGEMVFVRDFINKTHELELAYLFIIESLAPEFRDKVYVSALDGRVLLRDAQLKHGVGDTRYSGRKSFPTTRITIDTFELKGTEPISGVFCETRSLEGYGGTPASTPAIIALSEPIRDGDETDDPCELDMGELRGEIPDDRWDKEEHRKVLFDPTLHNCCPAYVPGVCNEGGNDDIALDAHWGASIVARYWKDVHNRNSYDDNGADILSFVHHGEAYENASWNGLYMKYGDGAYQDGNNPAAMTSPLVSLDVCAHEIGHAICTSTSDLVYIGESGAMNEGLSDIWAAAIEQYVLDFIDGSQEYLPWGIGEQIDERDMGAFNSPTGRALRWMDHPLAENNPDTYGGDWWQDPDCESPSVANDFCGIHFNSGVLNKWFYLLTVGSGQPFSPGAGKPAADDEINDNEDIYDVTGIGIRKAEKITYGAELLLNPNARFADMRTATIDIATSLYGPCSIEVEQTIRAWFAVGVGEDFGTCGPAIVFNQFNIGQVSEQSNESGCDAEKMVTLNLQSYLANETITVTASGSATEGEDFEICNPSITFNGNESKLLDIIIFDDKVEEEDETIILQFSGGSFSGVDTLIIINDDGIPAIGNSAVLYSEDFETDDGSWTQDLFDPNTMINRWYIDAGNTNQAHISSEPSTSVPTYVQLVESVARIKSPIINAIGRKNVEIKFDFEAGGESDVLLPEALFDYGTFQISYDGLDWTDIRNFVGTAASGGQVSESGTYTVIHPELSNRTFYLGFMWQNDALNGGSFSFKIDNIMITGEGLEIAEDVSSEMSTLVPPNERIAFISAQNEMVGILEDADAMLGCTQLMINANHLTQDLTASICKSRSNKVFNLIDENSSDSVTLTLFYKESEIDDWSDPTSLNILAVESIDIEQEANTFEIIGNQSVIVDDQRDGGSGYISYTFRTTSGFQSFALTDRPAIPQNAIVMSLTDIGTASLRSKLNDSCPGDTIRFDLSTNGQIIQISSGEILLNKELVIIGNGMNETTVSAEHLGRIFNIGADATVYFQSLGLTKGQSTNDGGAFLSNGKVYLENVLLKSNLENGVPKAFTANGPVNVRGQVKLEE